MRSMTSPQIAVVAIALWFFIAPFAASAQPPPCPAGQTLCAGACFNLQSDRLNCGGCGIVCNANQICIGGLALQASPSFTPANLRVES
jgi:hypothetical protein